MTKQYTRGFIRVVRLSLNAVLKQDRASTGNQYPSGYRPAQYHAVDGAKSIAGHILTRGHYKKRFEGYPLSNVELMAAIDGSVGFELTKDDRWLLQELEDYHDIASEQVQILGGAFTTRMRNLLFKNADILPPIFKDYH